MRSFAVVRGDAEPAAQYIAVTQMSQRRSSVSMTWLGPLFGALLGVSAFLAVGNLKILDPTNIAWLHGGDPQQHYLAWATYRAGPWTIPPGANPNWGLELAGGLMNTETIPFLALALKPFRSLLSEPFQYAGLWLIACFILQGVFAWKIAEALNLPTPARVTVTLLLLFSPPLLRRMFSHVSLAAHWLVLASLYFYIRPPQSAWVLRTVWSALLVIAALVHPYLLVMVAFVWIADIARRLWLGEANIQGVMLDTLPAVTAIVVALWMAGFFIVGRGYTTSEYGLYSMNLLSPINPMGWSYILSSVRVRSGQGEGFAYFGLGGLLLLVLALPGLLQGRATQILGKYWIPLLVALIALTLVAISHVVVAASATVVHIPLPSAAAKVAGIFRASGRMFWPAFYAIAIGALWLVFATYGARVATLLVAIVTAIQVVDSHAGWRSTTRIERVGSSWPSPFKSPFWNMAAGRYAKIRVLPVKNPSPLWSTVAPFSLNHGMGTDSIYFARVDQDRLRHAQLQSEEVIQRGQFASDSLYLFLDEKWAFRALRHANANDLVAEVDGFFLLAPQGRTAGLHHVVDRELVPTFPLGPLSTMAAFNADGQGYRYLGKGWSQPESWGVWSDGPEASLRFRLNKPAASLQLRLEANGFEPEAGQKQTVAVLFNDRRVATLALGPEPDWFNIVLPLSAFGDGEQTYSLDFLVGRPTSPAQRGMSADRRLLGIGLRKLIIQEP